MGVVLVGIKKAVMTAQSNGLSMAMIQKRFLTVNINRPTSHSLN